MGDGTEVKKISLRFENKEFFSITVIDWVTASGSVYKNTLILVVHFRKRKTSSNLQGTELHRKKGEWKA